MVVICLSNECGAADQYYVPTYTHIRAEKTPAYILPVHIHTNLNIITPSHTHGHAHTHRRHGGSSRSFVAR